MRIERIDSRPVILNWRWPHFSVAELSCKCAGKHCQSEYFHDPSFLDALEDMREDLKAPLIINSAHRCEGWNKSVGGATRSQHLGIAVDLSLENHDRFAALDAAKARGFTGLGLGESFLHMDRREKPATWYYRRSRTLWMR